MLDLVNHLLRQSSDLDSSVGRKLFPYMRGEETSMPAVMYEFTGTEFTSTHDSSSKHDVCTVEVYTYAKSVASAMAIATQVREALDGKSGKFNFTANGGLNYNLIESRITGFEMVSEHEGKVFVAAQSFEFALHGTLS